MCSDEASLKLAALRCGIEFGDFDAKRHVKGFLQNTITAILPKDLLKIDMEQHVLNFWNVFTKLKQTSRRELAIQSYLEFC